MSDSFFKAKNGLQVLPSTTAASEKGDIRYDSATDILKYYNGSERSVANLNEAQTLTNKTITGSEAASFVNSAATITLPTSTSTLATRALSETLSNKSIDPFLAFVDGSTPSNPAAGVHRVYTKSGGLFVLDSAGVETNIGAGIAPVLKTHADTGATLAVGFTQWTLTNASNDTATIPAASTNSGKVILVKLANTTTAFNTLTLSRSGSDTFTLADGTTGVTSLVMYTAGETYELIGDGSSVWHVQRHSTNAKLSLTFTSSALGTLSSSTFNSYRRGSRLFVNAVTVTGTSGNAGTDITFPTGLTMDTSTLSALANAQMVGHLYFLDSSSRAIPGTIAGAFPLYWDGSNSNQVYVAATAGATTKQFTALNAQSVFNSSQAVTFSFDAPITGWKE